MNDAQRLWWDQARAEYRVFQLLQDKGTAPCHQLHYLQMVTEKLGKAYFWRDGRPPRRSHAYFVLFLRGLLYRSASDGERIANLLGFKRFAEFEAWVRGTTPLAHAIERLAPDLAGDNGPNPEYPWPQDVPTEAPVGYDFPIWHQLMETGRGRHLLLVIQLAVERFPAYA